MPTQTSPLIALSLSLVIPGLGQLYNGERAKSLVVLCMDAGIGIGIALATIGPAAWRSRLSAIALGVVYLFVWIPAIIDAYQHAAGLAKPLLSGEQAWYVVFMLLTVGPGAIPLLWHSPRFSRTAKTMWTVFVILVFLGGILFITVVGPAVERWLQQFPDTLNTLR